MRFNGPRKQWTLFRSLLLFWFLWKWQISFLWQPWLKWLMRLKISARFWRQVFQKNPPEREREREKNKERKRRNWREREERNTGWEVELFPPTLHQATGKSYLSVVLGAEPFFWWTVVRSAKDGLIKNCRTFVSKVQ